MSTDTKTHILDNIEAKAYHTALGILNCYGLAGLNRVAAVGVAVSALLGGVAVGAASAVVGATASVVGLIALKASIYCIATKSYENDISPEKAEACERVGFRVAILAPIFIVAAGAVASAFNHHSNVPLDAPKTPVTTTIDGKSVSENCHLSIN